MKDKIKQSYTLSTHTYYVTLIKPEGEFYGKAVCSEDDYSYESSLFGFGIAEARANIAYEKYLLRKNREEYKTLNNFYKSLKCYRNFNDNSTEAKLIRRQLRHRKLEIESNKALIEHYHWYIKTKSDTLEKLRKVKSAQLSKSINQ